MEVSRTTPTTPAAATIVLGLGTLVSHGFGLSLVPALLPQVERTFDSGFGALGAAVAGGLVAYAAGGLAASRILDGLPNRTVLNGTFIATAIALAAASAAGSPALIALPVVLLGVSAPISWAATTHVAARSVGLHARSLVMAGAAGGVGLGVIVNGGLVRFFADGGQWRIALWVASLISLAVAVASMIVFRSPIDRPSAAMGMMKTGSYKAVFADWPGRVVVVASAMAGVTAYTFITFLTTTAIEQMGASAGGAGALLWAMGGVGLVASLLAGRVGDRLSPTLAVTLMFATAGLGLGFVSLSWNYSALIVAALAVAVLNYPVWGVVATIAANRFEAPSAVRAVSLGLVGAATLAAGTNIAVGVWIDNYGSTRWPIVALGTLSLLVAIWLAGNYRAHVLD